MCAFGDLWDANHAFTATVKRAWCETLGWDMIGQLRAHLTSVHADAMRRQTARTHAVWRTEHHQCLRDNARQDAEIQREIFRIALWNDSLLKKLNQEGILI